MKNAQSTIATANSHTKCY